MDTKKQNLLLEWGAKYTADELNTTDASYKIRVSTLENKGSVKWAVAANKWWNKVELFATAMSLVKDLSKGPERDRGGKRANDSCSDLKAEAKEWIVFCGKYSWIEQSNWNPSLECNERIILKFLDYLYSPTGRKAKLDLGETVLRGRMKRMADLGVIEDEETARTKVRHSYS
ncbi:hypothetical protein AXG93_2018s1360 [Marchantia polymorpha subsp. ruderalis]|uniref:Uncharacterized protein n=1 Tax=Marchantia polymorpha subsp. ruderalis TaxID=1480154 RepID=A0A176WD28_MARPO|nr:hypothetical protein AXG93_2018s1360 [Marchantia polymorpha subsp. ruderalis]